MAEDQPRRQHVSLLTAWISWVSKAEITQLPVITASLSVQGRWTMHAAACPPYVGRCQLGADTWKLYNECVTALSSFSAEICCESRVRRHKTCPAGGSSRPALLLGSCGTWTSRAFRLVELLANIVASKTCFNALPEGVREGRAHQWLRLPL